MTVLVLTSFAIGLRYELAVAQTMAFTAFVVLEYLPIVALRYQERMAPLANRWLAAAIAFSLGLQALLLLTPLGQPFSVAPLSPTSWLFLLTALIIGVGGMLVLAGSWPDI